MLETISYFRLSGYWYVLLENKETHLFNKESTFEMAFNLYCFDKELRRLILGELEKIEIAIRSQMTYIISSYFGPFWIEEKSLFANFNEHNSIISKITGEFLRSNEKFIDSYKSKYLNKLPPSWMLLEIISFGSLSLMYQKLKPGKTKREIAAKFGLDDRMLISWMHTMVYIRNICAHHSRLWNRNFAIRPMKLQSPQYTWLNNNEVSNSRLFYFASTLIYLLNRVNPVSSFKIRLIELIKSFEISDFKAMGFSDNWEHEPLWKSY